VPVGDQHPSAGDEQQPLPDPKPRKRRFLRIVLLGSRDGHAPFLLPLDRAARFVEAEHVPRLDPMYTTPFATTGAVTRCPSPAASQNSVRIERSVAMRSAPAAGVVSTNAEPPSNA